MKIINKKKFITSILEVITLIGTMISTPLAINYANMLRGYKGYGGEYLIPILGLIILIVLETINEENDRR